MYDNSHAEEEIEIVVTRGGDRAARDDDNDDNDDGETTRENLAYLPLPTGSIEATPQPDQFAIKVISNRVTVTPAGEGNSSWREPLE